MPTPDDAIRTLEGIGHTPDGLYHELISASTAGHPGLRVVALPGQRLPTPMRGNGDDVLVLVRVALGEPGLGCVAALASAELATAQQLRVRGVAVEEGSPGGYAVVVEGTRSGPSLARQITDAGGVILPGQLVLRVRGQDAAEAAFDDEDDPALMAWDDSPEVPDLLHAEVTAIEAALVSGDREKALKLMLTYLQRSDPKRFASDDLVDGKIHAYLMIHGTPQPHVKTSTTQGEAFAEFLKEFLEEYAKKLSKKRTDLTAGEVGKALKDVDNALKKELEEARKEAEKTSQNAEAAAKKAVVEKQIHVRIGDSHFATVSLLYSTVRHEWVHVEQLRADYLAYIPSSVLRGARGPDTGTLDADREVEAYLWEMENLAGTGLKDPFSVFTIWKAGGDFWGKAGAEAKKKLDARFKSGFAAAWKLAVERHVAAIAAHHAKFDKDGKVEDQAVVRQLREDLEQLWKDRSRFGIDTKWKAHEASRATAIAQTAEMLAAAKADEIKKQLDAADKALAEGSMGASDAYRTWFDLLGLWINLPKSVVAIHEVRFKLTGPKLWEKAFSLYEIEIGQKIKEGNAEEADTLLQVKIGTLWKYLDQTNVKPAAFEQRRRALQEEVKKALKN